MEKLLIFLTQFKKRGGFFVVLSSFGTKFISLVISVLMARMLTKNDYAIISYATMITAFIVPFCGFGTDFIILRYGALTKYKKQLIYYVLKNGLCFSALLVSVLFLSADFLSLDDPRSTLVIRLMLVTLIFEFLIKVLQNNFRVYEDNKAYASVGIARSLLLLFLSLILVDRYSFYGYVAALILSPLIVVLLFFKKVKIKRGSTEKISFEYEYAEMLKYGVLLGIGAMISQAQMPLAGLLLGWISGDVDYLAIYKVASIIPISLLFLPNVFFKSEFVHLVKNYKDKSIIKEYIFNYWVLFSIIFVPLTVVFILYSDEVISIVFGIKYSGSGYVFSILMVGVLGGVFLRQPFGNLMFASGRADVNVKLAFFNLLVSLIVLTLSIKLFGVVGAAYGTAIMFWFGGILSAFFYYKIIYRKIL